MKEREHCRLLVSCVDGCRESAIHFSNQVMGAMLQKQNFKIITNRYYFPYTKKKDISVVFLPNALRLFPMLTISELFVKPYFAATIVCNFKNDFIFSLF